MTVIATFLTSGYVLQVSDMKLTWPGGGVFEDRATKTVVFCGHFLFGYTGRACVAGLRTDYVIAEVLAGAQGIRQGIDRLSSELTRRLAPVRSEKRIVVAGAGWARTSATGNLRPIAVEISNVGDDGGQEDTFSARFSEVREPSRLVWRGQRPGNRDVVALERQLHRRVNAGSSPSTSAALIVDAVRRLSERNTLVGSALIVSCLPRRAVPAALEWSLGSPQWRDRATFLYVPESLDEAQWYGPGAACGGIAIAAPTVSQTDWVGPPRPCPPD